MKQKLSENKTLQMHTKRICTLCFILIWLPSTLTPMYAQSGESLNFQNEKLSYVLEKISEVKSLNFSYDANDPVYNTTINYALSDEEPDIMLDKVLSKTGLEYKKIGNQIVLFHLEEREIPEQTEVIVIPDEEAPSIDETAEVISFYEIDTIYIQDTIYKIDTIRVSDTVFIEKEKPEKQTPSKIKDLPVDFFQKETNRDKGWAGGVFVAPLLSDFSLVENNISFTLRSFSLGIDVVKLVNRWNFAFGFRLSHFSQQFTQQYSVNSGGNYQTDTIDIYYTVVEADTSWYYVTDSSWIPLESKEYNYERSNAVGYLEVNAAASYDFYKATNLRIYGKIGGQFGWMIYKDGIAIPDEANAEGVPFSDLQFNTTYALSAGLGLKSRMTDRMNFNAELYYVRYFNQLVKEYEFDNKLNAIGLKVGLIYYF